MARNKLKQPKKSDKPKRSTPKVKPIDEALMEQEESYRLPEGCELQDVEHDIIRYGLFEFEDAVYSVWKFNGTKGKHAFRVSNFTCRIEAHIELPEGTALKLLTIRNIYKEQFTYHVSGDDVLSLPTFRKVTAGDKGNFDFEGTDLVYRHYLRLMQDRMGRGRIIRELGMQPEGFFVFCNAVIMNDGNVVAIDEQGCFEHEGNRFYVPAAKVSFSAVRGSFSNARKVRYVDSGITWRQLTEQMRLVHREHSYMSLTFAVATLYRDHIKRELGGFPILFFFGEPGSGKDQCIDAARTLYGEPQEALPLTGSNTGPGQVNMFAEFSCLPLCLSEWKNDMKMETMEMVFSLWQGVGRRRGTKTIEVSPYATDSVPIECTAYCTGNDYPNAEEKGMTRFIVDEFDKDKFSADDHAHYMALGEMKSRGYSHLLRPFVAAREEFMRDWRDQYYAEAQRTIREALGERTLHGRMMQNIATLLSVFMFFERRLDWAFTRKDLLDYMLDCTMLQQTKRSEGDPVQDFWTAFIAAVREGILVEDQHYRIDGERIGFYWDEVHTVYEKVYRSWGRKKPALHATSMLAKLKRHPCFQETVGTLNIGGRRNRAQTFNMTLTGTSLKGLLVTQYPDNRHLGDHNGNPVLVTYGKMGPYLKNGRTWRPIPKGIDPEALTLVGALTILSAPEGITPPMEPSSVDELAF